MKKGEDILAIYRIANHYYNDNMSQQEIAEMMGVSRSQVSRLLILARERGIVDIRIKLPDTVSLSRLEKQLCASLRLERVLICDTAEFENSRETERSLLADVATFAAAQLPRLIENDKIIGIGRGRTIYNVSLQLPVVKPFPHRLFVPLTGKTGTRHSELQTSTIVNRFADKFSADALYVNSSFLRPASELNLNESWLRELQDYWKRLDTAIIGLGNYSSSLLSYVDEFPSELINRSNQLAAVGEIIGQPFSADGSLDWFEEYALDYIYIGIPLDSLRSIRNVICIASGLNKTEPIITAAQLGYYKTLIVDRITAEGILSRLE
jgi:DNA-binding transcriptional regulator LsrR (DeoR family)